jgi:uncharacterized protein YecE (DUF72 family)
MGIKIGCCGFPTSRQNYYHDFKLVEIQQTFYNLPKENTVIKWREQAPANFEFAIKAWQLITHEPQSPTYRRLKKKIPEAERDKYGNFKPTEEVFSAWAETVKIAQNLKASIVLFQCPASFTPSEENKRNMRQFFTQIPRENLTFVWEPRGKWNSEEIVKQCRELELIHCVDPFKAQPLYGDLIYLRLHGKTGYRYQYNLDDLEWLLSHYEKVNKPVYILFNNISMYEDALKLKQLLET